MIYLKQRCGSLRLYKQLPCLDFWQILSPVSVDKMEFCTIWKSEFLVFEMEIRWFLFTHLKSPVWVQSPDVKLTRLISMSGSFTLCPAVRVGASNSAVPLGTSHHREDVPKDFWRQNFFSLSYTGNLTSFQYLSTCSSSWFKFITRSQTSAYLHGWWGSPVLTLLLLLQLGATLKTGVDM